MKMCIKENVDKVVLIVHAVYISSLELNHSSPVLQYLVTFFVSFAVPKCILHTSDVI